jgi:solute carrier family 25 thiamine pyrophosphate transporter 19
LVTAAVVTTTTATTTAMILMYPSKCEASTNKKNNNNNNNNINPIVAGAFAGAVARVFVAPLDVIKIRLQIQKENYSLTNAKYKGAFSAMSTIAREEGIRKGLWAGTIPALCLWIPYTGIQFGMLNALNSSSSLSSSSSSSFLNNNFVFGAVAGATATVATYPFDIIRTQLASQGIPKTYNGVFDAFFGLLRRRKLYAGLGITLIEIIPATSVQFGVYEYLNSIGKESSNTNNNNKSSSGSSRSSTSSSSNSFELNHFAKGFLAGSCARVAIHPLDVMKKRLQVVGLKRAASYGAAETANKAFPLVLSILKTEGVRGFYKGLVPALCKSAPSSAITFGVYEFAMQVLDSFTNSLDEQE